MDETDAALCNCRVLHCMLGHDDGSDDLLNECIIGLVNLQRILYRLGRKQPALNGIGIGAHDVFREHGEYQLLPLVFEQLPQQEEGVEVDITRELPVLGHTQTAPLVGLCVLVSLVGSLAQCLGRLLALDQ